MYKLMQDKISWDQKKNPVGLRFSVGFLKTRDYALTLQYWFPISLNIVSPGLYLSPLFSSLGSTKGP